MSKPSDKDDGGYILPSIIDPPRRCFTMILPDDDEHLRIFWGALWEMTRWYNWQKDDDHTAKKVADVWRDVWMLNQSNFLARECMTDPCCPETNDYLSQILNLLKGGATINFNAVNQSGDFVVDCSPEGFSGNPDDTVPVQIQRANALCLAIARWLVACLYVTAGKMNNLSIIPDILALSGEVDPPTFVTEIEYVNSLLSRAEFNEMILNDTAFDFVVCAIRGALEGQDNSFVQFKKALSDLVAATDESTPPPVGNMLFLAYSFSQNRVNYAVFSRAIEQAFDDIVNGNTYTCPCAGDICDVSTFELIGLEGTIVTKVIDGYFRVQQTNFTDAPPDKRAFKAVVRDKFWRCFNLVEPTSGWAGYDNYDCDGMHITGGGGGTGLAVQVGMITLEYDVDPVVGIDVVFQIICP